MATTGNDTLIGTSGADFIDALGGDDSVDGGGGNDNLYGGDGNDTLLGGGGDDWLGGGAGDDWLVGGGNTPFGDFADYAAAAFGVNANLATGIATGADIGTDTLSGIENVHGSATGNDTLTGDGNSNWFRPSGGNDFVDGGGGIDTVFYEGSSAPVTVNLPAGSATGASIGNDTLVSIEDIHGSYYADWLVLSSTAAGWGRAGNDTIIGGSGDNRFTPGSGNDSMVGDTGFDSLNYSIDTFDGLAPTGNGVNVNLVAGTAIDNWGHTDTFTGIEIVFGSQHDDTLTGGNPASGSGSADGFESFEGNAGDDHIDGGAGFDRAQYTTSPAAVSVTLGGTADGSAEDGFGGIDTLVDIEEIRASPFDDTLTGSDSGDFESFEGRGGNDTIDGMAGTDRVNYQSSPAGVSVDLAMGTASDGWGGTDSFSNIENVRGSNQDDTLAGDDADNHIEANAGNDSLSGAGGNDTLFGRDGNDTLDGGADTDTAVFTGDFESYTLLQGDTANMLVVSGPEGTDLLIDVEVLQFADFTYVVEQGTEGADSLQGSSGDDVIRGRGGNDSVSGGNGNDALYGDEGDDSLDGGSGADLMDGGTGADTMMGGAGNDTYIVDSPGDSVIENDSSAQAPEGALQQVSVGGGIDKVVASVNYSLGGAIENLQLAPGTANLAAQGNAGANAITGNDGANVLTGLGGDDTIDGGGGIDTAAYAGQRHEYSISGSFLIDGTSRSEGTDTLTNVERLQFSDVNVALDLEGNAGMVAKIIGAVIAPFAVNVKPIVGIGLDYADSGMGYEALMDLAINAVWGDISMEGLVQVLFTNVVGVAPNPQQVEYFASLGYTKAQLAMLAADTGLNLANIGFSALVANGIEYV